MKRTSIAETTLKKQIAYCDEQIAAINRHIEAFNMQRKTYTDMRANLFNEQTRLRDQRAAASERANP